MVHAAWQHAAAVAAVDFGRLVTNAVERFTSRGDGKCRRAARGEAHLSLAVLTLGHETRLISLYDSCMSWGAKLAGTRTPVGHNRARTCNGLRSEHIFA